MSMEKVGIESKKKISSRGGMREGAGRPSEGKAKFTVTLTAENVKKSKAEADNFSGLIDRLLIEWLSRPKET